MKKSTWSEFLIDPEDPLRDRFILDKVAGATVGIGT